MGDCRFTEAVASVVRTQLSLIKGLQGSALILSVLVTAIQVQAGPLHDAVRAKDVTAIDGLLADGANIDETDYFVGTALHVAVAQGDEVTAGALIKFGANIEAVSELRGTRALHMAADFNDLKILALLLDHGADPESRDADGRTPLFQAALRGNTAAAELLLERGADVDAVERSYRLTPLQQAAENGNIATVKLLLQYGAEINVLDSRGFSALSMAAQLQSYTNVGDARLIELLAAEGADLQLRNEFGQTPREYAASRNGSTWKKIADALLRLESSE
ncbi:ankyrin repeat protein [Roseibium album]|nr:ankyrin repeat protein [Roseibium album]